jgi:hypothetical protein
LSFRLIKYNMTILYSQQLIKLLTIRVLTAVADWPSIIP